MSKKFQHSLVNTKISGLKRSILYFFYTLCWFPYSQKYFVCLYGYRKLYITQILLLNCNFKFRMCSLLKSYTIKRGNKIRVLKKIL